VDFNLTEQQQMFKNSVKKFTEQELTPLVDIMDKQTISP
jgi:hypothetical protein